MTSQIGRLSRRFAKAVRVRSDRIGRAARPQELAHEAQAYWTSESDATTWSSDSHWRSGLGDEQWRAVGRENLLIIQTLAQGLGRVDELGTVLDWGCGGGANAVAVAPFAERLILADVAPQSVAEAADQVRTASDVVVETLTIDLLDPERAATTIEDTCDTFICLYVLELTASVQDALRIVRIAKRTLRTGGIAIFQVKYRSSTRASGTVKRSYRRNLANMTIFPIDEFWTHLETAGLEPRLITLVPENELDRNYAYFAATRP
ncbi:class I SAM-dependent methyltransferase [Gordonia sp. ABSL11-1]|uniref:class I SAM-dependent methyltransferase n=1 Tax=Gordonia sp. ABSL11-1 TaxID=3053924 RepID=UPI0025740019|nr:class I SAM-dependent methyltransferase [Gordonia sp. ABSL11-1]MDL9947999.1 class I SAM-dependent methyltransferase [Gordonia sp. ABSL11-1]